MSSSVVVSPVLSTPAAMSRSSLRMILPLRVLGRESVKADFIGAGQRFDSLTTWGYEALLLAGASPGSCPDSSVTKAAIPRPFRSSGLPDDGCLGHQGMAYQSLLPPDLHRRKTVAGDVDHVVNAAEHPVVAVLVHQRVGMNGRIRKTMITALARKLLVAFWKYATAGVVIEGATMKTA